MADPGLLALEKWRTEENVRVETTLLVASNIYPRELFKPRFHYVITDETVKCLYRLSHVSLF